jgi:hypothetical protein
MEILDANRRIGISRARQDQQEQQGDGILRQTSFMAGSVSRGGRQGFHVTYSPIISSGHLDRNLAAGFNS